LAENLILSGLLFARVHSGGISSFGGALVLKEKRLYAAIGPDKLSYVNPIQDTVRRSSMVQARPDFNYNGTEDKWVTP